MSPQLNIIERAHNGNLHGLNFAGLVRLSFEINPDRELPTIAFSGADINNRDEQERLCRAYIESRGGTYVYTYDEPDTSAWKKKRIRQPDGSYIYRVIRPVFEGSLNDLKRGVAPNQKHIDGLIVYDVDRLTRDNRHLEDAIEVVEHFQRPILDIRGSLDLLTDNGRQAARHIVTAHNSASAATSRRLRDSHYARAIRGIPVGGNRPFGWQKDKRTLEPHEAELIKRAAKDLLNGIGPYEICRLWNNAGIPTPKGGLWRRRTLVLMLTSPRMVGWRVYGPPSMPLSERYIRMPDGTPVKGQYPAILDEETWHQIVHLLTGPGRPSSDTYVGMRKRLLSGIIRCGNCGKKLSSNAQPNDRFAYVCKKPYIDGGCGKTSGSGVPIDKLVTDLIRTYFARQVVEQEAPPWPGAAELDTLSELKASLVAQFGENPDMGQYIWPKIRELDVKIDALVQDRAVYGRRRSKTKATTVSEEWDNLNVAQRRAIIEEVIEAVILMPATRSSNRFDTSRVSVIWREG